MNLRNPDLGKDKDGALMQVMTASVRGQAEVNRQKLIVKYKLAWQFWKIGKEGYLGLDLQPYLKSDLLNIY